MKKKGSIKKRAFLGAVLLGGIAAAVLLTVQLGHTEQESAAAGGPLGMVFIDLSDESVAASYHVEECGVYVLAVDENSPAYEAGVRSGDRLLSLNGTRIHTTSELEAIQRGFAPAATVRMEFRPRYQERVLTMNVQWNGENGL